MKYKIDNDGRHNSGVGDKNASRLFKKRITKSRKFRRDEAM